MNAIKKAILELAEKQDVRTIKITDLKLEPAPSEVEFDSSMASVMHRVQREEAQAAAIKKAAEGSVK